MTKKNFLKVLGAKKVIGLSLQDMQEAVYKLTGVKLDC